MSVSDTPTKLPVRNFKSVGPFLKNRLVTIQYGPYCMVHKSKSAEKCAPNALERFTVINDPQTLQNNCFYTA